MHRTSLYFEEDALKALKLLAATSGVSVADKVREAVDTMLAAQVGAIDWKAEIDGILTRAQSKGLPDLSGREIVQEVRASRCKGSDFSKQCARYLTRLFGSGHFGLAKRLLAPG